MLLCNPVPSLSPKSCTVVSSPGARRRWHIGRGPVAQGEYLTNPISRAHARVDSNDEGHPVLDLCSGQEPPLDPLSDCVTSPVCLPAGRGTLPPAGRGTLPSKGRIQFWGPIPSLAAIAPLRFPLQLTGLRSTSQMPTILLAEQMVPALCGSHSMITVMEDFTRCSANGLDVCSRALLFSYC